MSLKRRVRKLENKVGVKEQKFIPFQMWSSDVSKAIHEGGILIEQLGENTGIMRLFMPNMTDSKGLTLSELVAMGKATDDSARKLCAHLNLEIVPNH